MQIRLIFFARLSEDVFIGNVWNNAQKSLEGTIYMIVTCRSQSHYHDVNKLRARAVENVWILG
jgi:hypothetical protein